MGCWVVNGCEERVCELDMIHEFRRGWVLAWKTASGNPSFLPLSLQNGYINFDKRRKVRGMPELEAGHS